LKVIPFQVQINFTKLDGTKCLRVLSKVAEVTHDREEAEKHVKVNVIGLHSQAQAAQLAAEGHYTKARMIQKTNMRMVRRTLGTSDATEEQQTHYNLWNQEALRLNSAIKTTKIHEKKEGLNYHSAEEDDSSGSDEEVEGEKEKESKMIKYEKKEKLLQDRKQRRTQNDTVSNVFYQAQNPLYSAFTELSNPLHEDQAEKDDF